MNADRRARAAALRAQAAQRLRTRIDRPFAPRRTRTRLAVGYVVAVAAIAAAELLPSGPWRTLQVVALVAAVVLVALLRRATRLVVDAPEEALDELLVRIRDHAFVEAYRALAAVTVLVAAAVIVGVGLLPGPVLSGLAWIGMGAALGLPLVVAATLPDADDADDADAAGPVPA